MRDETRASTTTLPSRTKSAQRRRRLQRGIKRWDFDRGLCAEPTRRIATLTLTVAEGDPGAAMGQVRAFWKHVRQTWLGTRYFCWLELQARGAAHYHAVWLNPPHVKRVNLLAWVDRHWPAGRTRVRFSDGRRGVEREIDYAVGYAKKMGRKHYQQRYEDVPRELRTFMSQRLEIPPPRIDEHLGGDRYGYVSESQYLGQHVDEHLVYLGRAEHIVPIGGRCSALDHRRPRPGTSSARHRQAPRAPPGAA